MIAGKKIQLPVLRLPLGSPIPTDHNGPFTIGDIPEPRGSRDPELEYWEGFDDSEPGPYDHRDRDPDWGRSF